MYKKEFFEKRTTDKVWSEVSMFSERLRILRKKKGETQESAAEKLGIPKATYGTYENGKYLPDAEKIAKMADFYNVSADYLLGLQDSDSSPLKKYNRRKLIIIDFSDRCVDKLLDISKNEEKKRAFEFLTKNKLFEEFLLYLDSYLLFSSKIIRNDEFKVKEAYSNLLGIDISSNEDLLRNACPDGKVSISNLYFILVQESLRKMLTNVSREDICNYSKEMMGIVCEEESEKE